MSYRASKTTKNRDNHDCQKYHIFDNRDYATFTRLDSLQDSNRYKTAPNTRHAQEKTVFEMSFAQQTAPMTRQHPLQDSNLYKTSFLLFYSGFLIKTTAVRAAAATAAADCCCCLIFSNLKS